MRQDGLDEYMRVVADMLGIAIPTACRDGVAHNLALFVGHAELVAAADLPLLDPIELIRP